MVLVVAEYSVVEARSAVSMVTFDLRSILIWVVVSGVFGQNNEHSHWFFLSAFKNFPL